MLLSQLNTTSAITEVQTLPKHTKTAYTILYKYQINCDHPSNEAKADLKEIIASCNWPQERKTSEKVVLQDSGLPL